MANIKKEIETLRAKIVRLENEQKKAEQQRKALTQVQQQIDKLLKENDISFETYIRSHQTQVSRILQKLEGGKSKPETRPKRVIKKKAAAKTRRSRKPTLTVKIPSGKYGNLPSDPEMVFEVKEKGPRPKLLKAYAEEIGLEAFLEACRIGA